jgi:predicted metallopeptidase
MQLGSELKFKLLQTQFDAMESKKAPDVQERLERLLDSGNFPHVNRHRVICMRSRGANARAYARIWSIPSIWREALSIDAFYAIEVLEQHFDKLREEEKDKVLIHELLHIPKNFTGGLVPHICAGKAIDEKRVNEIYRAIGKNERVAIGNGARTNDNKNNSGKEKAAPEYVDGADDYDYGV